MNAARIPRAYSRLNFPKPLSTQPELERLRDMVTHALTYEHLRSKFFVYGGEATQTDRHGARNSDCALEPRANHGSRGARRYPRPQGYAVHHRAKDDADHGGERPGTPRREAARAH